MPQIDKVTFFNQIFWLVVLFSSFYFILLKNFLPKLSAVLKVRTKNLIKGSTFSETSGQEVFENLNLSNQEVTKISAFYRNSLVENFDKGDSWLNLKPQELPELKKIHLSFLGRYKNVVLKKFSL